MKTKRALIPILLVFLLAGCGGEKYLEEKTVLSTATKAMEAFASSIESANTPDVVAQALGTFSSAIEKVMPGMKKMATEHADWETSPPDALKDTYTQFQSATEKFKGVMPKVMQMASQNPDNTMLQSAMTKFQEVVSNL